MLGRRSLQCDASGEGSLSSACKRRKRDNSSDVISKRCDKATPDSISSVGSSPMHTQPAARKTDIFDHLGAYSSLGVKYLLHSACEELGKGAFVTTDQLDDGQNLSCMASGRAVLPTFGLDDITLPDFCTYGCHERTLPQPKASDGMLDAFLMLFARGAIQGEEDWQSLDVGPRWELPSKLTRQLLNTARIGGVLKELLDVARRSGIGAGRFCVVQTIVTAVNDPDNQVDDEEPEDAPLARGYPEFQGWLDGKCVWIIHVTDLITQPAALRLLARQAAACAATHAASGQHQTKEEVPGLLFDWTSQLVINMRTLCRGGQLQDGQLLWSECDRLWSYGMSEPGTVFNGHSYTAAQQLAQVLFVEALGPNAELLAQTLRTGSGEQNDIDVRAQKAVSRLKQSHARIARAEHRVWLKQAH